MVKQAPISVFCVNHMLRGILDKKGTFTVIIRPVHIIRRDMYRLNSTNKKGLVGKFHSRARNWDRPIVTYRHYGKICCGNLDLVRAGDDYVDFVIHYTVSGEAASQVRKSYRADTSRTRFKGLKKTCRVRR
jgi:hypothetical protein